MQGMRRTRYLAITAFIAVLVGVGLAWNVAHRQGTVTLIVGPLREGLFNSNGHELYSWPKTSQAMKVVVHVDPGTYELVAEDPTCPPGSQFQVDAGGDVNIPFRPVSNSQPPAQCFPRP